MPRPATTPTAASRHAWIQKKRSVSPTAPPAACGPTVHSPRHSLRPPGGDPVLHGVRRARSRDETRGYFERRTTNGFAEGVIDKIKGHSSVRLRLRKLAVSVTSVAVQEEVCFVRHGQSHRRRA
jgi:hypothetical protein